MSLPRRMLGAGALLAAGVLPALAQTGAPDDAAMRLPIPGDNPWPIRQAPLPGVSLGYWDSGGDGDPVVLLHPASGSHPVFAYQREAFAAAGYRVISYARRGYRDSEAGPEDGGSHSDDLAALADHLGLARFHAVGSAQGSIVALDFALSRPGRLRSLTCSCTFMGVTDADFQRRIAALRPEGFARMPGEFRELGVSYRYANPEGTAAWHAIEAAAVPGRRVAQRNTSRITWAALGTLRTPTLLIGGEADLWAPPSAFREFHAAIPGSELLILRECGHAAHWEQPAAFNAAVLGFLGRHRG